MELWPGGRVLSIVLFIIAIVTRSRIEALGGRQAGIDGTWGPAVTEGGGTIT
jgi:hypothetical protein